MKTLILDNYDSFTYNLYQYAGEILSDSGASFCLDVKRNDAIDLATIRQKNYERIIISPGPGNPTKSAYFGVCSRVIRELGAHIPILGICLGMQGIAHVFGARIQVAAVPMHGKTTLIQTDGKSLFRNIPIHLEVMRYHSLIVARNSLPDCLEASAWTLVASESKSKHDAPKSTAEHSVQRELMGVRHREYPIEGIQFHPESFATEAGKQMIANFLM